MRRVTVVAVPTDDPQLVRMIDAQTVIEQALGNREDGGVSADGQRQRTDRDGCESGALAQHTKSVTQISGQFVPPTQAERGAHAFFVYRGCAELDAGPTGGFGRGVAGA